MSELLGGFCRSSEILRVIIIFFFTATQDILTMFESDFTKFICTLVCLIGLSPLAILYLKGANRDFWINVLLWIFLIIPGIFLVYSVCLSTRHYSRHLDHLDKIIVIYINILQLRLSFLLKPLVVISLRLAKTCVP
jgi:uncharacterized membrane protein YqaE (UPF0057 family)